MAPGDAFPTRHDLDAAAAALDERAARLSSRSRSGSSKPKRRASRDLVKQAWFAAEALRAAEPAAEHGAASPAALLALRTARDLELALAAALGDDPHAALTPPSPRRSVAPTSPPPPLRDPMRLAWPIRYDLDRIERLGAPARAAAALAGRVDDAAAEIEARAKAQAGASIAPAADRPREIDPEIDMDVMELAKSQRRRGPGDPAR